MNVKFYPKFIFGSYKSLIKTLLIVFGFAIGTGQYLQAQCSITTVNPSFELPGIPINSGTGIADGTVPGWKSADSSHFIEYHSNIVDGFTAYNGTQYIQCTYTAGLPSGVYQIFSTPVVTELSYSFAHRGQSGIDSVGVYEGPPGGPYILVQKVGDGTAAWGFYSGTFIVPAGQPITLFVIKSISTAGALGNFLDDVNVSVVVGGVTPIFSFLPLAPFCQGATVPVLPTVSNNGVPGTWNPSVIDNMITHNYVFTPAVGQCANLIGFVTTVYPIATPTFSFVTTICAGATAPILPTTSDNSISGTWSPAVVNNMASGNYIFTPTPVAAQCFNNDTISITVDNPVTPSFSALFPNYCMGAVVAPLSNTSDNLITGTWSPSSTINTAVAGTTTYTFTPTLGQCAIPFSRSVQINNNIASIFASLPDSVCVGDVYALGFLSDNSVSGTWSFAGDPSSTLLSLKTDVAGIYNYQFNPVSICEPIFLKTIKTKAFVTPTFTPIAPFCKGTTAPILPTTSIEGATGTWSPAVVDNMASGSYIFTPTPAAGKCFNNFTMNVTVNNPVTPSFSFATSVCAGSTAPTLPTVSNESITGTWSPAVVDNMTTGNYTFTPTAGQCATSFTQTVTILQPVTSTINQTILQGQNYFGHTTAGTYTDTYMAANGCDSVRTVNLTVNAEDCYIPTINPSFELAPAIAPPGLNWFFNDAMVPGWKTTEPDHFIEVWSNGFLGVPAYDGNQFVELNAYETAGLYQDFNTPSPVTFDFSYAHRGRSGVDVAGVYAGPPGGPYTLLQTATDGNTAWGFHTGSYNVPAGQPVTRFIFQAISENGMTGPNLSVGNFLDDVNFSAKNALLSVNATMNCLTGSFTAASAGVGNWVALATNPSATTISNPTGNNIIINGFGVPGIYKYTWQNATCVDTLVLTVNNNPVPVTPTFPEIGSFCKGTPSLVLPTVSAEGISGTWSPAVINNMASGTYIFTPNPGQCPATSATMNVTILQPSASTIYDTIPQGGSYDGYTTAGTYVDTYVAANGCDSVRTLHLALNAQNCYIPTVNPSFEQPYQAPNTFSFVNESTVPGWQTTEADHIIEVWGTGFNGVPAYDGNQFVELNAHAPSGLYQDYSTPSPVTFDFTYAHRGRAGVDVAGVYAGPPGGPYTLLQTATDGNTAWGLHTGSYNVPAGQPVTRFIFQAISENGLTGPNVAVGNFLDDVSFTAKNALISANATMNCLTGSFNAVSAGVGNWTALATNPSPTNISNPTGNNTTINGFGVAGIYEYTWQNASCIDTLVITVNNNPVPVTPTFPEITSFCKGTPSLVLPTVSTEGISGTWSPAVIDNMTSGTYTFTPTPGQCPANTATLSVTILQPSASTFDTTILQGQSYDGYTTAGTYVDTYVAANGCDSVRTLNLMINPEDCFIPTINPSFENYTTSGGIYPTFLIDNTVPGWLTTEPDHEIEVWRDPNYENVPSYDGKQFVELNANLPSGLYQDYNTPFQVTFTFTYAHRGRWGTDVAGVYAGPPGGPYTLLQTATDGNTAWGLHTGTYTVPAGQPVTRFIFKAISSSTGDPSVGNFLDDVNFTAKNALLSTNVTLNCLTGSVTALSAGVGNWVALATNPSTTTISNPTGNNTIISGFAVPGTYQYTWNNASCIDTLTIIATNNPLPVTPTFPEIGSFCMGTPSLVLPTVSAEGISGTWSPAVINNMASATYTFTPNPGQCPAITATINVTILQPSASITSDTICVSALPFTWNNIICPVAGTYIDTLVNAAGCDSVATLVLTVSNTVTPVFSFPTSLCKGTPAPLLPGTSDNSVTGVWNPAVVDNTTTGTYTFTPDPGQCTTAGWDTTITITVLQPSASTTSITICAASLPFPWNGNSYPSAGTYPVTLVNAVGCDSIVTLNLTVNAIITPGFSFPTSVCKGTAAPTLPGTSNQGITGVWTPAVIDNMTTGSYTFTHTTGQCAVDTTITITILQPSASTTSLTTCAASLPFSWNGNSYPSAGTYMVTLINAAGCDSIATLNLTVSTIISPSFSFPTSICEGTAAPSLPGTSDNSVTGVWSPAVVDNTTTATYTFTPGPGQCTVGNTTIIVTVLQPSASTTSITTCTALLPFSWNGNSYPSAGTYSVTLLNAAGCDSIATLNLTVSTIITPGFSFPTSICKGTPAPLLPGTSDNSVTGSWSPAVVDNTTTGTYTFTPNPGQCTSGNTIIIVTILQPSASTTSLTVCASALPFSWNGNSYPSAGTYQVTLLNAAGCDSIATLNLTVNAIITPSFSFATSICKGAVAPLLPGASDNSITGTWIPAVVDSITTGAYTFTPNPAQCASANMTMIVTILQPSASTTSLNTCAASLPFSWNGNSYPSAGTYSVTLVNAVNCDSIATLNLTVSSIIIPSFSFPTSICKGTVAPLLPPTSDNIITGTWSPAVIDNMITGTYTFTPNPGQCTSGNTTIIVTVNNPIAAIFLPIDSVCVGSTPPTLPASSTNGITGTWNPAIVNNTTESSYAFTPAAGQCATNGTMTIAVKPLPAPDLGPDKEICQGDTLVITPGTFLSYLWQDNSTADRFAVTEPGIYSVTVTNTCGSSQDEIVILSKECYEYFPSAFTPNGDGKNDYFRILNASNLTDFSLTIYNRWGQIVFQTNDYSKGWDGTFKSVPQNIDVFVYLCKYKKQGNAMLLKGTVTLIR